MIIKSHIRGGYRAAAEYMKEQGKNEYTRIVEISDPYAKNLGDAFQNMWAIASGTRCTKPLHHISINPMKDERLTDAQVLVIVARCEEVYGYKMFHHQRVIVEHIKDGRQHFHVIWNRVSLVTGKPVWPGHHWKKSKQVCREMEKEFGLKRPMPRQQGKPRTMTGCGGKPRHRRATVKRHAGIQTFYSPPRHVGGHARPSGRNRTSGANPPVRAKPHIPRLGRPKEKHFNPSPMPMRPQAQPKGWPLAAILDWKTWGRSDPRAFFMKWPELAF